MGLFKGGLYGVPCQCWDGKETTVDQLSPFVFLPVRHGSPGMAE